MKFLAKLMEEPQRSTCGHQVECFFVADSILMKTLNELILTTKVLKAELEVLVSIINTSILMQRLFILL